MNLSSPLPTPCLWARRQAHGNAHDYEQDPKQGGLEVLV